MRVLVWQPPKGVCVDLIFIGQARQEIVDHKLQLQVFTAVEELRDEIREVFLLLDTESANSLHERELEVGEYSCE